MKKFRIVTILLALCLITSSFVGNTFAKYTSEASGNDSAVVAKWSILWNAGDIAPSENNTIAFNLFNTIEDLAEGVVSGDDQKVANAATANDPQIIAPGTHGSFEFTVSNKSDVTAKYTITFTEESANTDTFIPVQYKLDNGDWKDDISALNFENTLNYFASGEDVTARHTVFWRWVFDNTQANDAGGHDGQTNTSDTALGVAAAGTNVPGIKVTAKIDVAQVN